MNIILDTSIILRQPKILSIRIPHTKIIIPQVVIEELHKRADSRLSSDDWRIELIDIAIQQGTIMVIQTPLPMIETFEIDSRSLSKNDFYILKIASDLVRNKNDARIASKDKELLAVAPRYGVKVLTETDIINLIKKHTESQSNEIIKDEILKNERKDIKSIILGAVIGSVLTITVALILRYLNWITSTINIWGTILAVLILGITLFVIREKKRFAYGIFEFLVGIFTIIILFQPLNFDYNNLQVNLDFSVKLLGGMYIMVRGQDNIVKSQQDKKIGFYLKDKFGIGQ